MCADARSGSSSTRTTYVRAQAIAPEQAADIFVACCKQEAKLKDQFGRFTIPDFTMANVDPKQFPHVNEATPIYVTQEAGDAIFVPSGWYHQVTNLEDTVSINHNWFNGYNVLDMWHFLQREYEAVEAELASLKELGLEGREFRDQCQLVMNANTGINYHEFRALLRAKASDLAEKLLLSDTESEDAQTALQQHLETVSYRSGLRLTVYKR